MPRIIPAGAGKRPCRSASRPRSGDHPRGCGEKSEARPKRHMNPGSSPRVRGKGEASARRAAERGIIPAGAGKRLPPPEHRRPSGDHPRGCGEKCRPRRARRGGRDHPRGCGEKRMLLHRARTFAGSSPRVRGKASSSAMRLALRGIIPAGAGKSFAFFLAASSTWDHPRGCGEKFSSSSVGYTSLGSSPRVRGKVEAVADLVRGDGIIPAGAGKSHLGGGLWQRRRDHPRGCGEKNDGNLIPLDQRGSSPRVRGKARKRPSSWTSARIIPAGAGKRHWLAKVNAPPQDHPRGCGEKRGPCLLEFGSQGSSPRVRGKVDAEGHLGAEGGIIPAGAGKSRAQGARSPARGDHPRGCGEKIIRLVRGQRDGGSSPRVRGKG